MLLALLRLWVSVRYMIREVSIRRIPALTNKKENLETAMRARNFINSPLLIEYKRRYLEFLEWDFWA
jgi:hypothetical protein